MNRSNCARVVKGADLNHQPGHLSGTRWTVIRWHLPHRFEPCQLRLTFCKSYLRDISSHNMEFDLLLLLPSLLSTDMIGSWAATSHLQAFADTISMGAGFARAEAALRADEPGQARLVALYEADGFKEWRQPNDPCLGRGSCHQPLKDAPPGELDQVDGNVTVLSSMPMRLWSMATSISELADCDPLRIQGA
jgi:hypothetical protein